MQRRSEKEISEREEGADKSREGSKRYVEARKIGRWNARKRTAGERNRKRTVRMGFEAEE